MPTLYLHMGSSKTGTSAIQVFLGDNINQLKNQGICFPIFDIQYPTVRKQRNAHFLVDKTPDGEANYEIFMAQIKELSKSYEKIILTDESIWNKTKNLKRFYNDATAMGIDVKLIVYLRRQDLYLQSQWAQNIKENTTKDFTTFIHDTKIRLNYYERLCKIANISGKENLIVRPYEKQQFVQENLLLDFMHYVGINNDGSFYFQPKASNLSLSGIYLEAKRLLNYHEDFATRANFSIPYLYRLMEQNSDVQSYSSNKFFTYEQQMECLSKYAEGNEKVAREFLGREDGVFFRDEIKKVDGKRETYSIEEISYVFAQFISLQHQDVLNLKNKIAELSESGNISANQYKAEIKKLQSTIDWISAPFYKKVLRKLKRLLKK